MEWLDRKEAEQAAKAVHEPPVFLSKSIRSKVAAVEKIYDKLSRKRAPKPGKPMNLTFNNGTINMDGIHIEGAEGLDEETIRRMINIEGVDFSGQDGQQAAAEGEGDGDLPVGESEGQSTDLDDNEHVEL